MLSHELNGPGRKCRLRDPRWTFAQAVQSLAVGYVPKVDRIARVEAFKRHRLGSEKPIAVECRCDRLRVGPCDGHHVIRMRADQKIGEHAEIEDRALLARAERTEVDAFGGTGE